MREVAFSEAILFASQQSAARNCSPKLINLRLSRWTGPELPRGPSQFRPDGRRRRVGRSG